MDSGHPCWQNSLTPTPPPNLLITRACEMRSSRSKFNTLIVAQPLTCRTIEDMHWIRIKLRSYHPYSSYTVKSSSSSLMACCPSVDIVPEPVNPFCNPIVLPAGRGSQNERERRAGWSDSGGKAREQKREGHPFNTYWSRRLHFTGFTNNSGAVTNKVEVRAYFKTYLRS